MVKKALVFVIRKMGRFALDRPLLKRFCLFLLNFCPALRDRLIGVMTVGGGVSEAPVMDYERLSPRAREIYRMMVALTESGEDDADRH